MKMPFHGSIVVIKRSGNDGSVFPLVNGECLMGRADGCDIRIQLATVSQEHCRIVVVAADDGARPRGQAALVCLSRNFGQTKVNGTVVTAGTTHVLGHKSIFTVGDRSFRWEYPTGSPFTKSPKKSSPKQQQQKSTPASVKGRSPRFVARTPGKRVSFGPYISPEYIDKTLPPSTPVRKGAVPPASVETTATPTTASSGWPDRTQNTPTSLLRQSAKKRAPDPTSAEEKKSVLKRNLNDSPLIKDGSGFRASPRRAGAPGQSQSPSKRGLSRSPSSSSSNDDAVPKVLGGPEVVAAPEAGGPVVVVVAGGGKPRGRPRSVGAAVPVPGAAATEAGPDPATRGRPRSLESKMKPSAAVPATPSTTKRSGRPLKPAPTEPTPAVMKAPGEAVTKKAARSRSMGPEAAIKSDHPDKEGSPARRRRASLPANVEKNLLSGTVKGHPVRSKVSSGPMKRRLLSTKVDDDDEEIPKKRTPKKPPPGPAATKTPKNAATVSFAAAKLDRKTPRSFYGTAAAKTPKGATKKFATPAGSGLRASLKTNMKAKKTPGKTPRKTLWSDVVKRSLAPSNATKAKLIVKATLKKRASMGRAKKMRRMPLPAVVEKLKQIDSGLSTGHANSPETIVIGRKTTKTPPALTRKGRKTPFKAQRSKMANDSHKDQKQKKVLLDNYEGLADMLKTPIKETAASPPAGATPKAFKTPIKDTAAATPKVFKTPIDVRRAGALHLKASMSSSKIPSKTMGTPKPVTPKRRSAGAAVPAKTPSSTPGRRRGSKGGATPVDLALNLTSFDFDSVKTPKIPLETFVSPMSLTPATPGSAKAPTPGSRKLATPSSSRSGNPQWLTTSGMKAQPPTGRSPKTPVSGAKRIRKTPGSEATRAGKSSVQQSETPDLSTMRKLFQTPKADKTPDTKGSKELLVKTRAEAKTPPDSAGLKKMLKTPQTAEKKTPDTNNKAMEVVKSPTVAKTTPGKGGLRKTLKSPGKVKTPDMKGLKKLLKTPAAATKTTPNMAGLRKMLQTPRRELTPDMRGVRGLLKTPAVTKTPEMAGLKKMLKTPRRDKTPDMRGIRETFRTPKQAEKTPQMSGIRELLKTPPPTGPAATPDMRGLKKLVRTPTRPQKTPDMKGMKKMFATPKTPRTAKIGGSSRQEATTPDMSGIGDMMRTPGRPSGEPSESNAKQQSSQVVTSLTKLDLNNIISTPRRGGRRKVEDDDEARVDSPRAKKSSSAVVVVVTTPKMSGKKQQRGGEANQVEQATPAKSRRRGGKAGEQLTSTTPAAIEPENIQQVEAIPEKRPRGRQAAKKAEPMPSPLGTPTTKRGRKPTTKAAPADEVLATATPQAKQTGKGRKPKAAVQNDTIETTVAVAEVTSAKEPENVEPEAALPEKKPRGRQPKKVVGPSELVVEPSLLVSPLVTKRGRKPKKAADADQEAAAATPQAKKTGKGRKPKAAVQNDTIETVTVAEVTSAKKPENVEPEAALPEKKPRGRQSKKAALIEATTNLFMPSPASPVVKRGRKPVQVAVAAKVPATATPQAEKTPKRGRKKTKAAVADDDTTIESVAVAEGTPANGRRAKKTTVVASSGKTQDSSLVNVEEETPKVRRGRKPGKAAVETPKEDAVQSGRRGRRKRSPTVEQGGPATPAKRSRKAATSTAAAEVEPETKPMMRSSKKAKVEETGAVAESGKRGGRKRALEPSQEESPPKRGRRKPAADPTKTPEKAEVPAPKKKAAAPRKSAKAAESSPAKEAVSSSSSQKSAKQDVGTSPKKSPSTDKKAAKVKVAAAKRTKVSSSTAKSKASSPSPKKTTTTTRSTRSKQK